MLTQKEERVRRSRDYYSPGPSRLKRVPGRSWAWERKKEIQFYSLSSLSLSFSQGKRNRAISPVRKKRIFSHPHSSPILLSRRKRERERERLGQRRCAEGAFCDQRWRIKVERREEGCLNVLPSPREREREKYKRKKTCFSCQKIEWGESLSCKINSLHPGGNQRKSPELSRDRFSQFTFTNIGRKLEKRDFQALSELCPLQTRLLPQIRILSLVHTFWHRLEFATCT